MKPKLVAAGPAARKGPEATFFTVEVAVPRGRLAVVRAAIRAAVSAYDPSAKVTREPKAAEVAEAGKQKAGIKLPAAGPKLFDACDY